MLAHQQRRPGVSSFWARAAAAAPLGAQWWWWWWWARFGVCCRCRSVVNANEAPHPSDILSVYNQPLTLSPTITLSPLTVSRPIYLKVLRVHAPSSTFV